MAAPEIARNLQPRGAPVFAPGAWPNLSGYVAAATNVYARLWSDRDECVWVRPMVADTARGAGYWRHQTTGPGTSESKQFVFGSEVTGGSWSIRYHDVTTDAIPWGTGAAGAKAVVDRLNAHSDISAGQVTGSFSGRTLTLTFTGDRGGIDIDSLFFVNRLTGSGDLSISGSTVTNGVGHFPTTDGGRGHWFWDMIAADANGVYAGDVTVQRDADAPARAEFWIDDPLNLTMTFPTPDTTTTVGGTAVPFEWVVSNIGKVPIRQTDLNIVNDSTNETVDIDAYGSWQSTDRAVRVYRLPYGRIVGNGTTWRWNLRVTAESGTRTDRYGTLSLVYATPPAPSALTGTLAGKAGIEYCTLAWTIGTDSAFVDQVVRVRPAGSISRGQADRIVWKTTDGTVRALRLYEYALNEQQIVSVSQRAVRSGKIVESDPREITITAVGDVILLSEREDSPYLPRTLVISAHDGRGIESDRGPEYLDILNLQHPIVVSAGVGRPRMIRVTQRLRPEGRAVHRVDWRLAQSFLDNRLKKTFLYRDALGDVFAVAIDSVALDHGAGDPAPRVDWTLRTIHTAPIVLSAEVT